MVGEFFADFWHSLKPKKGVPAGFWCVDKVDWILYGVSLIPMIVTYIGYFTTLSIYHAICFQDSVISLARSVYLFSEPQIDPFTMAIRSRYDQIVPPTPLHSIFLRVCCFLCFNYIFIGQFLSIFLCAFLMNYCFRRVLILTQAVSDPTFTTFLASVIPMRWAFLRLTSTSDTLGISLVCLSFISFSLDNVIGLSVSILLNALTRLEYTGLYFIFALLLLIRKSLLKAGIIAALGALHICFLATRRESSDLLPAMLCFPHRFLTGSIHLNPWEYFSSMANSISNLRVTHAMMDLFGPPLIGAIWLTLKSAPFGIFCLLWLFGVASVSNFAIYRLIIPAQLFSLLLGFDAVLSDMSHRKHVYVFAGLMIICDAIYSRGESTKLNFPANVWLTLAYGNKQE